jgi:putative pyruvate formate lyase activating enzyme
MVRERWLPSYLGLLSSGELDRRAAILQGALKRCALCPWACGVDRAAEVGRCHSPGSARVASWGPHFGEEPPLSGTGGSGTIFLAGCNLRCTYCQNADISQRPPERAGLALTSEELADAMLELQESGCHNINWVSPTHQVAPLVAALAAAARRGLSLPIVYNTNAYDAVSTLELLSGVVDIYLPDLKYADAAVGARLSGPSDYPDRARAAVREMFRQVGDRWRCAPERTLQRGLLVRILVLPGDLAGVGESLRWLAHELSPSVSVGLMSQYRPAHRAGFGDADSALSGRLTGEEYALALDALHRWNSSPETLVQGMP